MRFYTHQHKHYCGIDLHARTMYVCMLDPSGPIVVHKNLRATPEDFSRVIAPYRADLVVAGEGLFTWYWLSDLCARAGSAFVLGHALSRKASHGGKAKNAKIDAHNIAVLVRGGRLPRAYVYPPEMGATRDLLRRRCPLMRQRAELLAPMQTTNSPYHLPELGKTRADKANREGGAEHCPEPRVRKTIELDGALSDHYDKLVSEVALSITRPATGHDAQSCSRRQSGPGGGQLLALVLRYESPDSSRFPRVPDFVSYCRLVTCAKESAGTRHGRAGQKMGTPQLTWACAAAAVLGLRQTQPGKEDCATLERKPGKGQALTVRAPKVARAVYPRLTREHAFALTRFVTA